MDDELKVSDQPAASPAEGAAGAGTGTDSAVSSAPPAETPAGAPGLSAEQIEEHAYKATQKALAEARAGEIRAAEDAKKAAQQAQYEQQRRGAGQVSAAEDALDALDIRTGMYEEALALHPDMPQEAKDQLKKDLRNFKTIETLRAAQGANLHVKLADAASGEAMRTGKYTPKSVQAPAREPVGIAATGPAKVTVPDGYRSAVAELGLSEEELQQAYAIDRGVGF